VPQEDKRANGRLLQNLTVGWRSWRTGYIDSRLPQRSFVVVFALLWKCVCIGSPLVTVATLWLNPLKDALATMSFASAQVTGDGNVKISNMRFLGWKGMFEDFIPVRMHSIPVRNWSNGFNCIWFYIDKKYEREKRIWAQMRVLSSVESDGCDGPNHSRWAQNLSSLWGERGSNSRPQDHSHFSAMRPTR
jgi:hypothetical protein